MNLGIWKSGNLITALAAAIVIPTGLDAQSPQSGSPRPLAQTSFRMDFGFKKIDPPKVKFEPAPLPKAAETSTPVDCQMVKPVDPNFHSAMPIVKPSADKKYALRVIQTPPCKR
jgi:hypothetical protein